MAEPKKRGPLFWVIISVVALIAILGVVMTGLGYYVNKQAGGTISTSNPGFAAVKLLTLSDSDLEIIKEEPEKMQILVRNKKTGEYSLRRADEKNKAVVSTPISADELPDELKK